MTPPDADVGLLLASIEHRASRARDLLGAAGVTEDSTTLRRLAMEAKALVSLIVDQTERWAALALEARRGAERAGAGR